MQSLSRAEASGKSEVYQVELVRVLIANHDVLQLNIIVDVTKLVQGTQALDQLRHEFVACRSTKALVRALTHQGL